MILVPQNPVVVLPARVTPARRVLSVLPNPPVAHLHMPPLLPALVLGGRLRTQTRTGQSPGASSEGQAETTDLHSDHIHKRQDRSKGKGKGHDLNMTGVFLETLSAISASSLRPCISG